VLAIDIDVDFTPAAVFTLPTGEGCEPATMTVYNQSTGDVTSTWNWGDNTSVQSDEDTLTHMYSNPDNLTHVYNVTLTVATAGGCSSAVTQNFTLFPEVTADFSVINSGENCAPFNAAFQNNSIAADQYVWTFGDGTGSNLNSPTHTYANPIYQDTTYQVMLVALSNEGCKDTLYQYIEVSRTPVAFFAITDTSGCYPVAVTLDNGSVGADSYSWNYGTGETSINQEDVHTHNYFNLTQNPVVNNITLTAMTTAGCYDHYTLPITIPAGIEANFTYNPEGCSPFNSQFLNQSSGANSYHLDFWRWQYQQCHQSQPHLCNRRGGYLLYRYLDCLQHLWMFQHIEPNGACLSCSTSRHICHTQSTNLAVAGCLYQQYQ